MKKIIVPTDFSATAVAAFQYAHFLADLTGFGLKVIHVHDGYGSSEDRSIKKGSVEAHEFAQRAINQFVQTALLPVHELAGDDANQPPIQITTHDEIGSPADVILKAAREDDTQLIVMGGVGSGAISAVTPLFGSVARNIIEKAPFSVLVVPKNYGEPSVKRVALAYNVANELKEISHGFDSLRNTLDPEMHFVHVRDYNDQEESFKELQLIQEIQDSGFPGYPVELDLLDPGTVAVRLLDYQEEQDIDLLVMGRRKHGLFHKLLIGSEVKNVMENGRAPMLFIPVT